MLSCSSINEFDRADARIAEVVHQVEELFLDLDADEDQIDFPILCANAGRAGSAPRPLSRARTWNRCSRP